MIHNHTSLILAAALVPVALTGCGGGGSSKSGQNAFASGCPTPAATEVAAAVREYVAKISPTPMRFLVLTGGDSVLPDAGRSALQDKGPVFLFPADTALQAKVLSQLAQQGSYPTLLVLYGGMRPASNGQAVVRISGRYIGSSPPKTAPTRAVYFGCQDGQWKMTRSEEEQLS
jgi:hypothetical protein